MRRTPGLFSCLFLLAAAAQAQVGFLGDQFQVNTTTTYSQYAAAVDVAPDGGFLVVWADRQNFVRGQRYAAAGSLPEEITNSLPCSTPAEL